MDVEIMKSLTVLSLAESLLDAMHDRYDQREMCRRKRG